MKTHRIKSIFQVFLVSLFIILGFFPGNLVSAQTADGRSYRYDLISVTVKVQNTTVLDVEERQTFAYQGNYHLGWRSIPMEKIGAITDISVVDGETGRPLSHSSKRLNKLDPKSWGKYTFFTNQGRQNIEWYYNLTDTQYIWIIRYKVHGALIFGKDLDRLYWNVFTDYDVPVVQANATISLPDFPAAGKVTLEAYRSAVKAATITKSYDSEKGIFAFAASDFAPKEDFTIDATWPKGTVSEKYYWLDFFHLYYGSILSAMILLLALLIALVRWLVTEKFPKGHGTVVPQYEPPEHLKPAMAEVITKERLTDKGLAATIVDLAIRGYVRIEQEEQPKFPDLLRVITVIIGIIVGIVIMFLLVANPGGGDRGMAIVYLLIFVLLGSRIYKFMLSSGRVASGRADYTIKKLKPWDGDEALEAYERQYLAALFGSADIFSTSNLRMNPSKARDLFKQIREVKVEVYKDTEQESQAFEVGLVEEQKEKIIWVGLLVLAFVSFFFHGLLGQFGSLLSMGLIAALGLWAFFRYEARLNEHGRILKEEWLGFKLYLQVAERYRMQNLTPDLFEKYLPYAMVFGVEQKWAKAFETLNLPPPSWYGAVGGAISGGSGFSGGSFSPAGFSASFSSAFTCAFASSGAGGGGGGGAGGGGGGGGGGAG